MDLEPVKTIERFAPSPSGRLHLGHAYSAWIGYQAACKANGKWLLRIEDIDFTRCRPKFTEAIYEDLSWLDFEWPQPVILQSTRRNIYNGAIEKLRNLGIVYGCQCTRGDIALSAPHGQTDRYPGTCRGLNLQGQNLAWRLDMSKAKKIVNTLKYREIGQGRDEWMRSDVNVLDDIVLARRDIGVSYHLAVVVDDAEQDITHITRGADLENQTPIHILLQKLLGLATPIYRHHALIRDIKGQRLAKRYDSRSIKNYRKNGYSPQQVLDMVKIAHDQNYR